MKEKIIKKWLNILIMTFTSLEKYVHSKKCLKQRRQLNPTPHNPLPPPPHPHPFVWQSRGYFRAEKVIWPTVL